MASFLEDLHLFVSRFRAAFELRELLALKSSEIKSLGAEEHVVALFVGEIVFLFGPHLTRLSMMTFDGQKWKSPQRFLEMGSLPEFDLALAQSAKSHSHKIASAISVMTEQSFQRFFV